MIAKIKNYFNEWNLFEKTFIFSCLVLFITLAFIFEQPIVNTIYSITAITCAFLLAKGKWYGYIFGIICISLYIYISYVNKYYGESILHLIITLPIYSLAIINWFKNQSSKVVKIKKISKKETIVFIVLLSIIFIGTYFLLEALKTSQTLIGTFTVTLATVANYLSMRRSNLTFIAYCLDDIFIILLWLIPLINGDISLLNVTITMFAFVINDIYGVVNWIKIKQKQNESIQKEPS